MHLWDSEGALDMFGQGIQIQGDRNLQSDILVMHCASQHDAEQDGMGGEAFIPSTWSNVEDTWPAMASGLRGHRRCYQWKRQTAQRS